jgi:phage terminase small subunit
VSDLTPKQARFVEEYLLDLNATQAATRAGYSKKTANEQGAQLLAKLIPAVKSNDCCEPNRVARLT